MALAEKGKTHKEIAKEAGVSPNTIKAVLNKIGLDQITSTPRQEPRQIRKATWSRYWHKRAKAIAKVRPITPALTYSL